MQKIVLHITNSTESKTLALEDELSIGRTGAAQIVLDDVGLSRVNTTFFRDGENILVVDENSLNGTFLNGEKISGAPVRVFDGDEIKIGSETIIRVEIVDEQSAVSRQPSAKSEDRNPKSKIQNPKSEKP